MSEILNQAPRGGAFSTLNGEFYEGGQFMPDLGLPKGSKRKIYQVVHFRTAETDNIAEIKVNSIYKDRYFVAYRMAGQIQIRYPFFGTKDECILFAQKVLGEKAKHNESQGLMAHPTKLTIDAS